MGLTLSETPHDPQGGGGALGCLLQGISTPDMVTPRGRHVLNNTLPFSCSVGTEVLANMAPDPMSEDALEPVGPGKSSWNLRASDT